MFGGALVACTFVGAAFAVPTSTFVGAESDRICYANALSPAQVETVSRRELVQPALEQERYIPAVYEQRRLRVMVKDAGFEFRTSTPIYRTVFEDILVEPAREIEVKIPAKYETWTETIEVEPAKTIWKRGKAHYQAKTSLTATTITDSTAVTIQDVLCKVVIPAKKRTVHHTRMVSPPRTETQTVPARYKRVARQMVQRPAFTRRVAVSGEYAAIPYEKQLIAARREVETIPARYQDVQRTRITRPSQPIRVGVLCDQHATRDMVRDLQTALVDRGYKIKVDGIYGPETQGAMEQFQRDERLLRGYMTLESIAELGVTAPICAPGDCQGQRVQTTVAATQSALSAAGYTASIDGIHGPQTQSALEQFQNANGLEVGYLSAETMRALNIIALI